VKVREPPYLQQSDGGLDVCGEYNTNSKNITDVNPSQYTTLTKEATLGFSYRNNHPNRAFAVLISALSKEN